MRRFPFVAVACLVLPPLAAVSCSSSSDSSDGGIPPLPELDGATLEDASPVVTLDSGSDASPHPRDAGTDATPIQPQDDAGGGQDADAATPATDAASADAGADGAALDASDGGWQPPVQDGVIGPNEYGDSTDGHNEGSITQDGKTYRWFMTWDDTFLYVGVQQVSNQFDPVLLYLNTAGASAAALLDAGVDAASTSGEAGADAGPDADAGSVDGAVSIDATVDAAIDAAVDAATDGGEADASVEDAGLPDASDAEAPPVYSTTAVLPYDSVSGTLPFAAESVSYFKCDYDDFMTANASAGWTTQQHVGMLHKGCLYDAVAQIDTREAAIPWAWTAYGKRPVAFEWLGYGVSSMVPRAQVPPGNLDGADDAGSNVALTEYYLVPTAAGTPPSAFPFALVKP